MTREEWKQQGEALFGSDQMQWNFVCPVCGHVQSVQDYKDAGAPSSAAAFSCVGRWREKPVKNFQKDEGQGCDYAGGGLIQMNPLEVDGQRYFDFYREPVEAQ